MTVLSTELQALIHYLEHRYENDSIDISKVESATSALIVSDNFESLPENIQNEILFLDNYEIEEPSVEQITNSIKTLKDHVKKNSLNTGCQDLSLEIRIVSHYKQPVAKKLVKHWASIKRR
jgi:hypothetical protein